MIRNEQALKDIIYNGILGILSNTSHFYYSTLGSGYSKYLNNSDKIVSDFIMTLSDSIFEVEKNKIETKAKDLILSGLKGE